jgi:hypothetical protein
MSGTQPENDGIIPQKSLTDRDEMGKTGNGRKGESVDIKRSGSAGERGELYNNNFKSCFPHSEPLIIKGSKISITTVLLYYYCYSRQGNIPGNGRFGPCFTYFPSNSEMVPDYPFFKALLFPLCHLFYHPAYFSMAES